MAAFFIRFEKRARYLMCFLSIALVLVLIAYQREWISAAPTYPYKNQAWYVQHNQAGFIVISEYQDQFECTRNAPVSAVCRSGEALSDEAKANLQRDSRS